jgi:hypothetical protein
VFRQLATPIVAERRYVEGMRRGSAAGPCDGGLLAQTHIRRAKHAKKKAGEKTSDKMGIVGDIARGDLQ